MWCRSSHSRTQLTLSSMPWKASIRELGRTGADHRVGLLGDDHHRHPGRPQPLDAQAVSPADPHRLLAVLVDTGGVVGVHAVEVGEHHVHVDVGHRWVGHTASALASTRSSAVSTSMAVEALTATGAIRPKKRWLCCRKPGADMT